MVRSSTLGVTTVTATRASRSASEATVPRDVVDAAPRSGAGDLLRLVPGLVASQHSGEGKAHQLFLRGFDAVHGQDVELSVAGIPVNQVSHLHAQGYADLTWLIPEAVREVRVTDGTYRAEQGDFAVAGTVRYELGLAEQGLELAAGVGTYGRSRLFVGVQPTPAPETFAALEYVRGDGFGPQRAFDRASLLAQAVVPLPGVRLRAVVGSAAARFDSPGVVREDALLAGSAGFFSAHGARQGGATARHQALVGLDLPTARGRLTLEAWGALTDLLLRNNFTGFLHHAEGDGLEQTNSALSLGARALAREVWALGGAPFAVELGLSSRRDQVEQAQRGYREVDGAPTRLEVQAAVRQTDLAAWLEAGWSPGGWRLTLGGRADVLGFDVADALAWADWRTSLEPTGRRSALGTHLGLKAGVERALGPQGRLFLLYGDGFRSPQARQLSDGERAPFVDVHGAEVGAAWERPGLTLKGAAFGSYVANDFFFDHAAGTTVSTGATLRAGAAVQVVAAPVETLLVSANVTAAQAQVVATRSLLPSFAPLVGRLDASWRRPLAVGSHRGVLHLGLGGTALGPRPLPFGDWSQPVGLLDARAAVRVGRFELALDVQNVLDARWLDGEYTFVSRWEPGQAASLVPARHFTAGAPRTLFLTLALHTEAAP